MTDKSDIVIQIRFHARGGQGGVTASQLCVDAFEGYGVNQPSFGAERMGSPTESYARLSKNPNLVRTNEQVYTPNYVGVLDDSLLKDIDVTQGMFPGGYLIVNTTMSFDEIRSKVKRKDINFAKLDATGLALKVLGRNITNTVILGAIVKIADFITLDNLQKAVYKTFKGSLAEKNATVIKMAVDGTEVLDLGFKMDFSVDSKKKWSQTALGNPGFKELDLAGVWYTPGGSAAVNTGSWGIEVAEWNKELCINCHRCFLACPDMSIKRELQADGNYHVVGVDDFHCKGCGVCTKVCPKGALTLKMKK